MPDPEPPFPPPTDEPPPRAPSRAGGPPSLLRSAVGWMLVTGAALFGAAMATCGMRVLSPPDPPEEPASVIVERPTPSVLLAVRDLARLEGTSFHMERVVDLRDRQQALFGLVAAEDAILLVAAGDVVAGVDLTRMGEGDVVVDPDARTATLTLPPPEVLSARLDNERTFVHTRATDTLARRNESLETRARQQAERTLRDAAVEAGILDRARQNTATTIEALVRSLGYAEVTVRFADAEGAVELAPGP